jgi:simple sugar transport system ATP-binding protein
VSKRFGALTALNDISAEFRAGEIHAVVGENGAGKSSLMNIMAGFLASDSGQVTLGGQPVPAANPIACRKMGIEMIHQHFMLVPAFTEQENLALNQLPGLFRTLNTRRLAEGSESAAKRLGWEIQPNALVRDLSVGAQQRLEILKALGGNAKVLIFDEPTAVLSPVEVEELFTVLRKLKESGSVVILIAHKLSEVFAVADRVTVLQKGQFIATAPINEVSPSQLADWMVGEFSAEVTPTDRELGLPVVRANEVTIQGDRGQVAVGAASFEIRAGEIVGFGGVDGNGQDELAEALDGIRSVSGDLVLPADLRQVGYVPQDRQADGLALGLSVTENLLIKGIDDPRLVHRGWLKLAAIKKWSADLVARYRVKVTSPSELVGSLSGGNQQKVVVARALDSQPKLLVAVNPTRGLDIRATHFVHESIRQAANAGAAVALFSTDLDELRLLSTRMLFMSGGKISQADSAEDYLGGKAATPA